MVFDADLGVSHASPHALLEQRVGFRLLDKKCRDKRHENEPGADSKHDDPLHQAIIIRNTIHHILQILTMANILGENFQFSIRGVIMSLISKGIDENCELSYEIGMNLPKYGADFSP